MLAEPCCQPVPIGAGLDYTHHCDTGARGGADAAIIFAKLIARDQRVRPVGKHGHFLIIDADAPACSNIAPRSKFLEEAVIIRGHGVPGIAL